MGQTACKPGSVRALAGGGRPFIWDVRYRTPHATNPGGSAGMRPPAVFRPRAAAPIRSCSRWGLPCRSRCRSRGALLPPRFTLTGACAGGLFSVALSLGSPPPGVTRHRVSVEPGLSSLPPASGERAAIRPSGKGVGREVQAPRQCRRSRRGWSLGVYAADLRAWLGMVPNFSPRARRACHRSWAACMASHRSGPLPQN